MKKLFAGLMAMVLIVTLALPASAATFPDSMKKSTKSTTGSSKSSSSTSKSGSSSSKSSSSSSDFFGSSNTKSWMEEMQKKYGITSDRSSSGSSGSSSSKSVKYDEAVKAYNKGNYYDARESFEDLNGYEDSDKYLRLIRIRNAGSNIGMGSDVYYSSCGLTYSDMKDIDAAAKDFYFADTADVLLCNSDVACYYLQGNWSGGAKCYINFKANNKGGWSYTIGSKLSTNYKPTFSINDNLLRVDVLGTNKLTLGLILLSPDCMEVRTFEKNDLCYVLERD